MNEACQSYEENLLIPRLEYLENISGRRFTDEEKNEAHSFLLTIYAVIREVKDSKRLKDGRLTVSEAEKKLGIVISAGEDFLRAIEQLAFGTTFTYLDIDNIHAQNSLPQSAIEKIQQEREKWNNYTWGLSLHSIVEPFLSLSREEKDRYSKIKRHGDQKNLISEKLFLLVAAKYQELTGKRPTVTTRVDRGIEEHTGPFIDFINIIAPNVWSNSKVKDLRKKYFPLKKTDSKKVQGKV